KSLDLAKAKVDELLTQHYTPKVLSPPDYAAAIRAREMLPPDVGIDEAALFAFSLPRAQEAHIKRPRPLFPVSRTIPAQRPARICPFGPPFPRSPNARNGYQGNRTKI